jgi:hypothetical protein
MLTFLPAQDVFVAGNHVEGFSGALDHEDHVPFPVGSSMTKTTQESKAGVNSHSKSRPIAIGRNNLHRYTHRACNHRIRTSRRWTNLHPSSLYTTDRAPA